MCVSQTHYHENKKPRQAGEFLQVTPFSQSATAGNSHLSRQGVSTCWARCQKANLLSRVWMALMQRESVPHLDWDDCSVSQSTGAQCKAMSSSPEIIHRSTCTVHVSAVCKLVSWHTKTFQSSMECCLSKLAGFQGDMSGIGSES